MKRSILSTMVLAALLCGCARLAQDALRYVPEGQTALTEWEFSQDGTNWEAVTVPHSYNAVDGRLIVRSRYEPAAARRESVPPLYFISALRNRKKRDKKQKIKLFIRHFL